MSTPSVRIASVPRSASRTRRISSTSISSDTSAAAAIPASTAGQKPIEPSQAADHVRAEQQQRALREVDHAGGAEDRHEAERDERVDRAQEQPADQQGHELVHAAPPR